MSFFYFTTPRVARSSFTTPTSLCEAKFASLGVVLQSCFTNFFFIQEKISDREDVPEEGSEDDSPELEVASEESAISSEESAISSEASVEEITRNTSRLSVQDNDKVRKATL